MDGWLLQRAEDFCHWWQMRYGSTNFFWARLTGWLFAVALLAPLPWILPLVREVATALALFAVAYAGLSHIPYRKMERYYMAGEAAAHPTTLLWRNMWRTRMVHFVVTAGMFAAAAVVRNPGGRLVVPYALGSAFLLAAMFFKCVIPLPPGAHRQYQLERSRGRALQQTRQLAMVPTHR
jgi:uncharacterized membrane protein